MTEIKHLKSEYHEIGITKFMKKYKVWANRVYAELGYPPSETSERNKKESLIRKFEEPLKLQFQETYHSSDYEWPWKQFMNRF